MNERGAIYAVQLFVAHSPASRRQKEPFSAQKFNNLVQREDGKHVVRDMIWHNILSFLPTEAKKSEILLKILLIVFHPPRSNIAIIMARTNDSGGSSMNFIQPLRFNPIDIAGSWVALWARAPSWKHFERSTRQSIYCAIDSHTSRPFRIDRSSIVFISFRKSVASFHLMGESSCAT